MAAAPTYAPTAAPTAVPTGASSPLRIQLTRFEFYQLRNLDQVEETFAAHVYIELCIPNGKNDTTLMKQTEKSVDGLMTTFKSARFYLERLELRNALQQTRVEEKIIPRGDDLLMILRVDATFFDRYELQDFPIDTQDMKIQLGVMCAESGPCPVQLLDPPVEAFSISADVFKDIEAWELNPTVSWRTCKVQTAMSGEKVFPQIDMMVTVQRRPWHMINNYLAPILATVTLSLISWNIPREDVTGRLSVSLTLMAIAMAYRFTASLLQPKLRTATLLDYYINFMTLFLATVVLENGVMEALLQWTVSLEGEQQGTLVADRVEWLIHAAMVVVYVAVNVHALWVFDRVHKGFYTFAPPPTAKLAALTADASVKWKRVASRYEPLAHSQYDPLKA